MADATNQASATSISPTLDVKILSQLPEPHGTIHFPAVASKTTVGELKVRIRAHVGKGKRPQQDAGTTSTSNTSAVASTTSSSTTSLPDACESYLAPVEYQRLIYRGRVMADDSQTLADIFRKEASAQDATHSLHLVIREVSVPTSTSRHTTQHATVSGGGFHTRQQPRHAALVGFGVAQIPQPLPAFPQVFPGATGLPQASAVGALQPSGHGPGMVLQQTPFAPTAWNGQPNAVMPQMVPQMMPQMPHMPMLFNPIQIMQQQMQQILSAQQRQLVQPPIPESEQNNQHIVNRSPLGTVGGPSTIQDQHQPQLSIAQRLSEVQAANLATQAMIQTILAQQQQQQQQPVSSAPSTSDIQRLPTVAGNSTSALGVPPEGTGFQHMPQLPRVLTPPTGHQLHQVPGEQAHLAQSQAQQAGQHVQPSTVATSTHEPNVLHGVDPNNGSWSITINATTQAVPMQQPERPYPAPITFTPPHQTPMGLLQLPHNAPVHATALQRQSSSGRSTIPAGMLPPLGLTPFHGSLHAINSMRNYEDDLVDLNLRTLSLIEAADAQAANQVFQQAQQIISLRNAAQSIVNNVMMRTQIVGPSLSAADIATLQSLNDRFLEQAQVLFRNIRHLRDGVYPHDVGQHSSVSQQRLNTHHSNPGPSNDSRTNAPTIDGTTSPLPSTLDEAHAGVMSSPQLTTTTYLLYDPTGLHAVVFEPMGTFSGSAPSIATQVVNGATSMNQTPSQPAHRLRHEYRNLSESLRANGLQQANQGPTNEPPHDRVAPLRVQELVQHDGFQDPLVAQAQDVQNQLQVEEARDLVRPFVPFFRGLWLLIRVFGFIWLFTQGNPSRRALLLGVVAAVFFAAQAGLFGERWERIRRHFEGLIGGRAADRDEAQPVRQANGLQQNRRTTAIVNPTPEETATRLLRERQDANVGRLRSMVTAVERTVALFLASLYPGLGEAHVAARRRLDAQATVVQAQRPRAEQVPAGISDEERAILDRSRQDGSSTRAAADAIGATLREAQENLGNVQAELARRDVGSEDHAVADAGEDTSIAGAPQSLASDKERPARTEAESDSA